MAFFTRAVCAGLFLWMAGAVWAALRICSGCGHEAADETATVCAHCGAALPVTAEETAAPAETTAPSKTVAEVDPLAGLDAVLADQVRTATSLFEKKAYGGALLFARNAAALAGLCGKDGVAVQGKMENLVHTCQIRQLDVAKPCPVCDGTGKKKKRVTTMKGDVIDQVIAGAVCASCGGTGEVPGRTMPDQLRRGEAEARHVFDLEQRTRGLIAWQGIYVPPGLTTNLEPRQVAALRHGYGVWCTACNGFRRIGCSTCSGAGISKCTNKNCMQGQETCPKCNGKGRLSVSRSTSIGSSSTLGSASGSLGGGGSINAQCASCNGTGIRPCATCGGKGVLICKSCKGEGDTLCKKCNGSGTPAVCTKCKGDGTTACTRCQGKGTDKKGALCEACAGRGYELCKSCEGSGTGR